MMIKFFHWGWLLGIALLAPAALPAGGAQLSPPQIRRRECCDPLLALNECLLRGAPCKVAPVITSLKMGTPMRVMRVWDNGQGESWLHIQVLALDKSGSQAFSHGWLNV